MTQEERRKGRGVGALWVQKSIAELGHAGGVFNFLEAGVRSFLSSMGIIHGAFIIRLSVTGLRK